MNRQHEKHNIQRKKIWEIDECYQCAMVGTCLSRSEMRQLSRERVFSIDQNTDDYELHSYFIRISRQPDIRGKALHRYIVRKYRRATSKYFRVSTDAEIEDLWKEDVAEGRIDSAWWAVLTQPRASMELTGRLYGQLHMLGHDCLNSYFRKKQVIAELKEKVAILEEVLTSERHARVREKRQLKEDLSVMESEMDNHTVVLRENQYFRDLTKELKERIDQLTSANIYLQKASLEAKVTEVTNELGQVREELSEATARLTEMNTQQRSVLLQNQELANELASLEGIILQHIGKEDPCEKCNDQHTEKCPGQNLCGRTVLYVGGLNKMVPHYRQLVEKLGGRFMHHDGGKEVSRNLLPKMLVTADAVFCPIDCVSHDACHCVKKICKHYQKPFVLMRSSSLSSLAKGLADIVQ